MLRSLTLFLSAGLLASVTACGGSAPPPEVASGGDTDGGPDPAAAASTTAASSELGPPPSSNIADPEAVHTTALPCSGAAIDLAKILQQASCELPAGKPGATKERDAKGVLEVKVLPAAPKVAPGGKVDLVVQYTNKSAAALPLDFVVDPEPRFEVEVYTAKGARADLPHGKEPPLPDTVASAPAPEKRTARAILTPNGSATMTLHWDAVRQAWAPAKKAKGAIPGRGYPRVPAGPLAPGKYTLKVVTPLTGFAESSDKEITQPKVEIAVGR